MVTDLRLLSDIGHIGIIFLLFLLGLDMQPQALWSTLRKSTVVAIFSSAIFMAFGSAVAVNWCRHDVLFDHHRHKTTSHNRITPPPYR